MKALVIGGTGFIGEKILNLANKNEVIGTYFSKPKKGLIFLDVSSLKSVSNTIKKYKPATIIYACGLASVDLCQENKKLANSINAESIKNIAKYFNGHFVYLSTHYVFDGNNPPYTTYDKCNACNIYAQSKINGENLTKKLFKTFTIVRLDTLYGYNSNYDRKTFVTDVLDKYTKNMDIKLNKKQLRCPILIDEAATRIWNLIENHKYGIYQFASKNPTSKYGWAKIVVDAFFGEKNYIKATSKLEQFRSKNPQMISDFNFSDIKTGLQKMKKQMEYDVIQKFYEDIEYFDENRNYKGLKNRDDIHTKGDFHMAVQAFIIKKDKSNFKVLSQLRNTVDIAKQKYDHSIAVQMIPQDFRNPVKAIKRGLKLELGIDEKNIDKIQLITKNIDMRSGRKYGDEPRSLYNREFVNVVLVTLKDYSKINPHPIKIKKIKWVSWENLVINTLKYPFKYTKNLKHNFVNTFLCDYIKNHIKKMAGLKFSINNNLTNSSYYSPKNNEDIVVSKFKNGDIMLQNLNSKRKIITYKIDKNAKDILKEPDKLLKFFKICKKRALQ